MFYGKFNLTEIFRCGSHQARHEATCSQNKRDNKRCSNFRRYPYDGKHPEPPLMPIDEKA